MSPVREKQILVAGHTAAYSVMGSGGTPVVLVHGAAGDRGDWRHNIDALAVAYRVYAVDLPGYGRSADPEPSYSVEYFAEFLIGFVRAIGIERAHLVGHSLGGRVCLDAARKAPGLVARMVVVAPLGFGGATPLGAALYYAAWAWFRARRRPLPYPGLDIVAEEPDIGVLAAVETPTCVLWGGRDRYFPARYGERVAGVLPNAVLRVIDGCGHALHRDCPEEFNRIALDFLAGR